MKHIQADIFSQELYNLLRPCVGKDYAYKLAIATDDFFDFVIRDVEETSAWQEEGIYTDDDIRLAIGRAILFQFGIPY